VKTDRVGMVADQKEHASGKHGSGGQQNSGSQKLTDDGLEAVIVHVH
jgi:hypothetical protein